MKILITYHSLFGTTETYARWLSEELHCDYKRFNYTKIKDLEEADCVVVASGTYSGWMPMNKFILEHERVLRSKRLIILAVGIAPVEEEQTITSFQKLPTDILHNATVFKLPGKIFKEIPEVPVQKQNLDRVISTIKTGKVSGNFQFMPQE